MSPPRAAAAVDHTKASPLLVSTGRRWSKLERTTRSLAVVVLDVGAAQVFGVAAVEDQQPVQALGANGADEAFGDRVRPSAETDCGPVVGQSDRTTVAVGGERRDSD